MCLQYTLVTFTPYLILLPPFPCFLEQFQQVSFFYSFSFPSHWTFKHCIKWMKPQKIPRHCFCFSLVWPTVLVCPGLKRSPRCRTFHFEPRTYQANRDKLVALTLILKFFPIKTVVKSVNKYPDKLKNGKDESSLSALPLLWEVSWLEGKWRYTVELRNFPSSWPWDTGFRSYEFRLPTCFNAEDPFLNLSNRISHMKP
jgi:hypothetical protein